MPHSRTAAQPHSRTAAQPHSRTAAQLNVIKALALSPFFASSLIAAGTAQAHQKGDFIVRLGVTGTHVTNAPSDRMAGGLATPALELRLANLGVSLENSLKTAFEVDNSVDIIADLIAENWDPRSVAPLRALGLDWTGVNIRSMNNAAAPTWDMTWFMTDYLALDVAAAIYKHDIKLGYGGENQGTLSGVNGLKFADTKHEQLAVGLTYYPLGNSVSRIHPYVGLGTSYTKVTTTPHRDWINFESARIDDAMALGTNFINDVESFEEGLIREDFIDRTNTINTLLANGTITQETAEIQRLILDRDIAEDRSLLAGEMAAVRQTLTNEVAASRQFLDEDAARRTHFYSWKANARIGADINLTDKFLITTQAGYTRVDNVGYWNYLLGFGLKL